MADPFFGSILKKMVRGWDYTHRNPQEDGNADIHVLHFLQGF